MQAKSQVSKFQIVSNSELWTRDLKLCVTLYLTLEKVNNFYPLVPQEWGVKIRESKLRILFLLTFGFWLLVLIFDS